MSERDDELEALRAELEDARRTIAALRAERDRDRSAGDVEAQYRRIFEATPEPIVVHVDARIVFANEAAARGLGFREPADLVGRSMLELAHGESRAQMEARMASDTPALTPLPTVEQQLRRADGRVITAEVTTVPFVFEGRAAAVSVAHDVTERKRKDEAIRAASAEADRARRRLEATLDALPVAVWIMDRELRVLHMNAAVPTMFGMPADASAVEVLSSATARWESTGERLRDEEWPLARTLLAGETILAQALELELPDGARRHVLSSSAPIRSEDGQIEGGVAVTLDVSDRFAAEREREELIASLEFEKGRLGTVLERAPAVIAVTRGPEHVLELVNAAGRALVGDEGLLGQRLADVVPDAGEQSFVAIFDRLLRTGEPFVGTALPLNLTRGEVPETRFFNVVCQPIVDADGTCSGVFALGVDVTEEVLVARRVRAQFEALPMPTLVFRRVVHDDGAADFLFVDHNTAATKMTSGGIGPLGVPLSEYLPRELPIVEDMRRSLDDGEVRQRELDYRFRSTEETRRFVVTVGPILPDLVVLFADDVTHRHALEEQLRQSQKMEAIGRLAGGVAHDFNNLLSVILSYTSFLREAPELSEAMREDVDEIQRAGERAGELTRQLLMFSRQQVIAPTPLRLGDCVLRFERMLRRLIGEDVELTLSTKDAGTVRTDPAQVDLVLMNLAVNARDAMPRGGTITIETRDVELDAARARALGVAAGAYVELAFRDTGVGMDAVTKERLFEPFFTTKEVGKGTGLGLATVFGIVRQSGGTVAVSSELGEGSTLAILLPRIEESVTAGVAVTQHPPANGSETILLVDDDEGVRRAARSILARAGYHVLEATTVGDAILLGEQPSTEIDLLLTDVVMPLMTGPQLASRLVALRPELRVLFVSGYAGDELERHGATSGAFLQKPFTPDSLVRRVREVLDEPRRGS